MEEYNKLGLSHVPEGTPAHPLVLIGLVAIQDKESKKWCATHETRGWYMPAGRVDFGEGISTGAKREALEEAGVHVDLTNIIRIDFSPNKSCSRFRAIYQADLTDDNQKLRDKSTADNEIIEACWVTPNELEDGRKCRTLEMAEIFTFIEKTEGSLRVPANFIESIDGNPIDHSKVKTDTYFSCTFVILTEDYEKIGLSSMDDYYLFTDFMKKPQSFTSFALDHPILQNVGAKIAGYCKLRYSTPHDQFVVRKYGHLNVVVVVTVSKIPKQLETKLVSDVLDSKVKLERRDLELVKLVFEDKMVYPTALIQPEGFPLQSFSREEIGETKKNCVIC